MPQQRVAFECWSCGACCKLAGLNHPELDRGDGICKNLTPDNLCSIYNERPDFCRLNPKRPAKEQGKWCKLIEKNWEYYRSSLEGLTEASGCGILVANEKDEG